MNKHGNTEGFEKRQKRLKTYQRVFYQFDSPNIENKWVIARIGSCRCLGIDNDYHTGELRKWLLFDSEELAQAYIKDRKDRKSYPMLASELLALVREHIWDHYH